MPPGDLAVRQCPQPGSTIEVTASGAAVFSAAHLLYQSYLASPLPDPRDVLGPDVGPALLCLLDACHDLIEH
jgi:hypothetical protein